jgi:methylglutaconyl-CoA hydratase
MNDSLVKVDNSQKGIKILTLNQPNKRNALNIPLMKALKYQLEQTLKENNERVVILQGTDPAFCTGLDLNELTDHSKMSESADLIEELLTLLFTYPLLTIAAAQGAALAGGAGLLSVCDVSIGEEGTKFGFPEVHRGVVPAIILAFLRRLIRQKDLKAMMLLGEIFSAEKALQMGLISHIVPKGELQITALKMAQAALKGAPSALFETKRLFLELYPTSIAEDLKIAARYHIKGRGSQEASEGIQAFLEKRNPSWFS